MPWIKEEKENKDFKGIIDEDYVQFVLEELQNLPIASVLKGKETEKEALDTVDVLLGELSVSKEELKKMSFSAFMQRFVEAIEWWEQEEMGDNVASSMEKISSILNIFMVDIYKTLTNTAILSKIAHVNYFAFKKYLFDRAMEAWGKSFMDQNLFDNFYKKICPTVQDKRFRLKDIIRQNHNAMEKHWIPGFENIENYRNKMLQAYRKIYSEVLFPFLVSGIIYEYKKQFENVEISHKKEDTFSNQRIIRHLIRVSEKVYQKEEGVPSRSF